MESLSIRAKSICRSLLPSPWCGLTLDSISVQPITTGRSNRLFICSRPSTTTISSSSVSTSLLEENKRCTRSTSLDIPSSSNTCSSSDDSNSGVCGGGGGSDEVNKIGSITNSKVIVRFYGSEHTGEGNRYKCVTDEEEIAILRILSSQGMSPAVLNHFTGGRIDEYVESIVLPPKQLSKVAILDILAPKIAQYHAIPFECERTYDLIQLYRDNSSQAIKILTNFDESSLPDRSESSLLLLKKIKSFFTGKPAFKLIHKMTDTHQRKVFAHLDLNYTNFLFPKSPLSPSPDTEKKLPTFDVMIIDVENSANNFRGIDLGKFFSEICLNDGLEDMFYIQDSAIHSFINSYLAEWKKIVSPSKLDQEIDNHDHLALEIQLGFLFNVLFTMAWNVLHPNFGRLDFLQNTVTRIDLFNYFSQRWSKIIQ